MAAASDSSISSDLDSPKSPSSNGAQFDLSKFSKEVSECKEDLFGKIQNLKQDLQEWRGKLASQAESYDKEIKDLKISLAKEVEELKAEFHDLKNNLRKQMETTCSLKSLASDISDSVETTPNTSE